MKDKRLFIGIALTTAWIGVAGWTLMTQAHPDKLNEWGDFIAGFSAPLAFFWLVLGYLQQGQELKNNTEMLRLQAEELKHSTDALRLQAEELKNSVEQQTQLVAVTREQIKMESDALAEERQIRRRAALPKFVCTHGESFETINGVHFRFGVRNVGPTATDVEIRQSNLGPDPRLYSVFDANSEFVSSSPYRTDEDFTLSVKYRDADGVFGEVRFNLQLSRNGVKIGPAELVL